jgi:hypothetical protein
MLHQFCLLKLTERILKMFKQKNSLIAVAVVVLLTACGGGGGGSGTPTDPGTNTTPTGGGGGGGTPVGTTVQDTNVAGFMRLGQVAVNGNLFDYPDFQGTGIYAQAKGTVAPLQTFGLRVTQNENPTTGASGNGHVGVELMDVAANAPQQLQLIVDRVDYKIGASGDWTVAVPASAKLYVHVKNSTGGVADMTVTGLPADVVKAVAFGPTDPGAQVLTVDIDKALVTARAKGTDAQKAVLDSLKQFKGTFNMNVTFSALNVRYAAGAAIPAKLEGANITVGGETAQGTDTKGSGVKGKFSIDVDPTQP